MMGSFYRTCRFACRFYIGCLNFGRAFDRDNVPLTGPVILVCNHQSFLDPVVVGYSLSREVDYMARETLFRNRTFNWLATSLNAFPVKRGQVDVNAVKQILTRLRNGRGVVVFPEGTRTPDGRIHRLKPGLDVIARRARSPIVPVVVDGAFEAWPRTSKYPKILTPIHVVYGKPLQPDELPKDSELATRQIRHEMIALQHKLRAQAGRQVFDYKDYD